MKINENVLCVLKYLPDSNLVSIDYEPIAKTLEYEFELVRSKFINPNITAKQIIFYIKCNQKLRLLFESFDYCNDIDKSYQGLYECIDSIVHDYPSNFDKTSDKYKDYIKSEKARLLHELDNRLLAYYLKATYDLCEQTKEIIAYSHRKVGWSAPKYHLSTSFTIEFKTNFGYGTVSYFYTKVTYKQFEIVGFADWVEYHNAKIYEVILYSSKHLLKNDNWQEAMEYVRDAYNLSIMDDVAFVNNYIIKECDRLIVGLERINNCTELRLRNYNFLNQEREHIDLKLKSHSVVDFRGEKITGALNLIKIIRQFEKVVDVYVYIQRIEELNRKILPTIFEEEKLVANKIKTLVQEQKKLIPEYNMLNKKNELYNLKKSRLRQELSEMAKLERRVLEQEFFEKQFLAQNNEYLEFQEEFIKMNQKIANIISEISFSEKLQKGLNSYIKSIKEYFNEK